MGALSCSSAFTIFTIIWGICGFSIFLMSIWCLIQHIKQKTQSSSTALHILTILLYILTLLCSLSQTLMAAAYCTSLSIVYFDTGQYIFAFSWAFQWFTLLIVLYSRLFYAFKGSAYHISKIASNIFAFLYVIFIFIMLLVLFAYIMHLSIFVWTFASQFIIGIILSLYVSILFVYKLYHVNKMIYNIKPTITVSKSNSSITTNSNSMTTNSKKQEDQTFVSIITKSTILSTISIGSTLLLLLGTIIVFSTLETNSEILLCVWNSLISTDMISNFCCITLTNKWSETYYLFIFGCCDNCCRSCCFQLNQPARNESKSNTTIVNELTSYIEETNTI
eukprot:524804_1